MTTQLPTTCASYILQGFKGVTQSTVTSLLENAEIEVVAKTNMDEFGMGSYSKNSAFAPVQHGRGEHAQSVGGSSGGSALAVADGLARFGIGSDTGGSVRLPAAYTGIFGFKPSYGRISRNGLVPYANSLDTVGLMATSIVNIISLYKVLDKPDSADPTCLTPNTRLRIQQALLRRSDTIIKQPTIRAIGTVDAEESLKLSPEAKVRMAKLLPEDGLHNSSKIYRIGVPDEYNIAELHPLVRRAWTRTLSHLASLGHEIVQLSLPTTRQALAAYYVIAPAEASSNLAKYDGVRYGIPRSEDMSDDQDGLLYSQYRGQHFGEEVKRRILLGTFSLSAGAMDNYFIQAQKVRRLVQHDFNNVFALRHPLMNLSGRLNTRGVDFIVAPTAPGLPPLMSELEHQSALDSYTNDVFTVPASLAGLPAISVPVAADEHEAAQPDRHIGMQVIGQYGDDTFLLSFVRDAFAHLDTKKPLDRRVWKNQAVV